MQKSIVILLISLTSYSQIKNEEFKSILEEVFILESIEAFFLDMNPIYILDNEEIRKNKIQTLGSPFIILSKVELNKNQIEDYIVFDKVSLEKDVAKIVFRYDHEGVFAEIDLKKQFEKWTVLNSKVFER